MTKSFEIIVIKHGTAIELDRHHTIKSVYDNYDFKSHDSQELLCKYVSRQGRNGNKLRMGVENDLHKRFQFKVHIG